MPKGKQNGSKPAHEPVIWRDRIVGHGKEAPDQLLANPRNFRIHSKTQQNALLGVIREVGLVDEVIVNQRTGFVVNGHLRVALALRENQPTIPVKYIDVDEAEEAEILATFDPIGALAATDASKLDELLRDVQSGEQAVQEMLAELARQNGLYQGKAVEDPGAQVDRAELLTQEYGTAIGQVWQLGQHRLAVGDSTDPTVLLALMGDDRADMVWTDPPYGVDYAGGRNPESNIPRQRLAGDKNADLYTACLMVTPAFCKASAPWYLWFADRAGEPAYRAVISAGYKVRSSIVWNKLDAHYGNFTAQYMQKHELCLYCVRETPPWYGPTNEVTVWDVKQPAKNELHPTQKPLELADRAIRNSSAPGAIVADWFVGSGPALIVCEQLRRVFRGVELDPGFAAVSIKRWEDLTGGKAVLADA